MHCHDQGIRPKRDREGGGHDWPRFQHPLASSATVLFLLSYMSKGGVTGLEPVSFWATTRCYHQLSYTPHSAPDQTRTGILELRRLALVHLSFGCRWDAKLLRAPRPSIFVISKIEPIVTGSSAPDKSRTCSLLVRSQALFQLSFGSSETTRPRVPLGTRGLSRRL